MVKLGWCAAVGQAKRIADSGLDYVECGLSSLQVEDSQALEEQLRQHLDSPVPVRALNLFAPAGMKLVGPQADRERIRRYVSLAGEAVNRLGVQRVVLGSGQARMVPPDWERQRAEAQFLECLQWIADEWRDNGATLVIEPLNRKECNFVNSVGEAAGLARQINSPVVRALADFYHMEEERESVETIVEHRDWVAHIHIADTGRRAPGTGVYPYERLAEALRTIGYAGMISAECEWPATDEQWHAAVSFMRDTFVR